MKGFVSRQSKNRTFNLLEGKDRATKQKKQGKEMEHELNLLQNHQQKKISDQLTYLLLKH